MLRLAALLLVVGVLALLPSDYSVSETPTITDRFIINSDRIEGEGVSIFLLPPGGGEPLRTRIEFRRATIYGLRLSEVSPVAELGDLRMAVNQKAPGPVVMTDLAIEATGFNFAISGGCLRLGSRPIDLTLDGARVEAGSLRASRADFSGSREGPAFSIGVDREAAARSGAMIRLSELGNPSNLAALKEMLNRTLANLVSGDLDLCGSGKRDRADGSSGVPPATAGAIPSNYLRAYRDAADEYGLDWSVLAAIGMVESGHGGGGQEYTCVAGPPTAYGSAVGPMQFLRSTWEAYGVDADGDGARDVCFYRDAIFGAANYLDHSGAPEDYYRALYAYNNSREYVRQVLALAEAYRDGRAPAVPPAPGGDGCRMPSSVPGGVDRSAEVVGNREAVFTLPPRYMDGYTNDWGAARPNGGHEGTDIFAPEGTPIYSITDGIVRPAYGQDTDWWNYLGGWIVVVEATESVGPIRAGDELYYAHQAGRPPLEFGQRVKAGDVIGYVGHTGYSSVPGTLGPFDPHLHLGWYVQDSRAEAPSGAKNPYPLLEWLRQNGGRATGADPYVPPPGSCGQSLPVPAFPPASYHQGWNPVVPPYGPEPRPEEDPAPPARKPPAAVQETSPGDAGERPQRRDPGDRERPAGEAVKKETKKQVVKVHKQEVDGESSAPGKPDAEDRGRRPGAGERGGGRPAGGEQDVGGGRPQERPGGGQQATKTPPPASGGRGERTAPPQQQQPGRQTSQPPPQQSAPAPAPTRQPPQQSAPASSSGQQQAPQQSAPAPASGQQQAPQQTAPAPSSGQQQTTPETTTAPSGGGSAPACPPGQTLITDLLGRLRCVVSGGG